MAITNYNGEQVTPNQMAKTIIKMAINTVSVETELGDLTDGTMTAKEIQLVVDQVGKLRYHIHQNLDELD